MLRRGSRLLQQNNPGDHPGIWNKRPLDSSKYSYFSPPGIQWYERKKKVQSHQINRFRTTKGAKSFGRDYNKWWIQYGFGGWGMVYFDTKVDRSYKILPLSGHYPQRAHADAALTTTCKSLSPQFRTFALADGGVLVCHPSQKQVLEWGKITAEKESVALGQDGFDQSMKSQIQRLIADNTLELVPLSSWRRQQLWRLIRTHGVNRGASSLTTQ